MSSHLSPRPTADVARFMQVEAALVHIADASGRLLYVSPGWVETLGYPPSEALQLTVTEVLGAESLASYEEIQRSLALGAPPVVVRLCFRAKDGRRVAVSGHVSPTPLEDGGTGTVVIVHDDTALAAAAEAARAADESLRLALDSVDDGLWDWVPLTGKLETTQRWATMLGFDPGELGNDISAWEPLCHPDDLPEVQQRIAAHLEGHTPSYECEHRLRRKDGSWAWILGRAKVVARDAAGRALRVIGTNVDVSDRKAADLAMAESESRAREAESELRALFAAMHDVVIILDRWGRYLKVVPTAQELLLVPIEQIVGRRLDELFPPDIVDRFLAVIAQALAERKVVPHEYHLDIPQPDGTRKTVHFEGAASPLGDDTVLWIARDITERKELEDRLRESQKMEAIGRIAGGIAHDFNNLLGVIQTANDLARDTIEVGHAAVRELDDIDSAAVRAATLTRQLLAFSRQQILEPRATDVDDVVRGMESLLRKVLPSDVRLDLRLQSAPQPAMADAHALEQALMNLVANARDALPAGGTVQIRTAVRQLRGDEATGRSLAPGRYILLAVKDDGIGMPAPVRARIFEPFFSTKAKDKGSGLGLSSVYGMVKQIRGQVECDTAPGRGTEFRLWLPAAAPDIGTPDSSTPGNDGGRPPGPPPVTILLVDDEALLREATRRAVMRRGCTVEVAASGADALMILDRLGADVDLVLTDVVMPGMNGHELARQVLDKYPTVPVALTSGYFESDDTGVVIGGRHLPFFPKPVSREGLTAIVEIALTRSRTRHAPA